MLNFWYDLFGCKYRNNLMYFIGLNNLLKTHKTIPLNIQIQGEIIAMKLVTMTPVVNVLTT